MPDALPDTTHIVFLFSFSRTVMKVVLEGWVANDINRLLQHNMSLICQVKAAQKPSGPTFDRSATLCVEKNSFQGTIAFLEIQHN